MTWRTDCNEVGALPGQHRELVRTSAAIHREVRETLLSQTSKPARMSGSLNVPIQKRLPSRRR